MKKFLSIALVIILMLSIVACGNEQTGSVEKAEKPCLWCGANNLETAAFCGSCGSSLNDDNSAVVTDTVTNNPTADPTNASNPTTTVKPTAIAKPTVKPTATAKPTVKPPIAYSDARVGSTFEFGVYEQDNNLSNGKEKIDWLILDKKDGKILVISKYALDTVHYNNANKAVTWETCTLRKWLNEDFYNSAFSQDEKGFISLTTVSAEKNPLFPDVDAGKETKDKVFLLSISEAEKYFDDKSGGRKCYATDYSCVDFVKYELIEDKSEEIPWWLRTPGKDQNHASYAIYQASYNPTTDEYGSINLYGQRVDGVSDVMFVNQCCIGVCPAMWIDISK